MRLFIAIALDRAIRERLGAVQSELRMIEPGIKPVETENIHLTLRFLGEVAEPKLPELSRAIGAVQNYPAFKLDLQGLGAFPDERHPKVVWVRGLDSSRTLEEMYGGLEKELLDIGFPPDDHKFSAHITLGRNKSPKYNNEFRSLMNKYSLESFGRQAVNKVSLLQSVLMPAGPIYTNIRDF